MAAVASSLAADRYGEPWSSSTSTSASSSSSSGWSSSSTEEKSSWNSSSSDKKKKKKKNKCKSTAVERKKKKKKKTKHRVKSSDDGDEVSSMLLLGAELLKEVEEAAAASASAAQMEKSPTSTTGPLVLPIGHYVIQAGPQSRSILLDQVMSSVPAAQWQAILPPVLKEMNSAELKQLCLQQLQLLSDSAILNIINGEGDQGAPAGKTISSEAATATGEKERLKKKKLKKSKKAKKKTKRSERSDVAEEDSSGKTLMELLELEMRARAIKALLKKEEEGQVEDDEWTDHVVVPLDDAIQRPLEAAGVSSFVHRPSSPPPTIARLIQRIDNTDDAESKRRSSFRHDEVSRKYQQPRHYRRHHHRRERSRSPLPRRGRAVLACVVQTESKNKSPTPPASPPASPLLIRPLEPIVTEQPDTTRMEEKGETQLVVEEEEEEEEEQVDYEEEGIQEVDIELGSGSDD